MFQNVIAVKQMEFADIWLCVESTGTVSVLKAAESFFTRDINNCYYIAWHLVAKHSQNPNRRSTCQMKITTHILPKNAYWCGHCRWIEIQQIKIATTILYKTIAVVLYTWQIYRTQAISVGLVWQWDACKEWYLLYMLILAM